ncbi:MULTISPECIES: Na+/H+ antiporter subunit E [unclassified Bradyrhizobium]
MRSWTPFEPLWMLLYRYASSRFDASRLPMPNAAAPPKSRLTMPKSMPKAGFSKRRRRRQRNLLPIEDSNVRGYSGRDGRANVIAGASWWSAASRAAWFLGLWLVLAGAALDDIPAAAVAVAAATWTSLRLLEPGTSRRSLGAISRLALLFLFHSVVAGADVARRALDPRLPLRPGFVAYPTGLPRGLRRNVFATLTSLLPGTVPAGEDDAHLLYHCLDVDQPVVAELAEEEAALVRALYND